MRELLDCGVDVNIPEPVWKEERRFFCFIFVYEFIFRWNSFDISLFQVVCFSFRKLLFIARIKICERERDVKNDVRLRKDNLFGGSIGS